jgi:hypothetical protein
MTVEHLPHLSQVLGIWIREYSVQDFSDLTCPLKAESDRRTSDKLPSKALMNLKVPKFEISNRLDFHDFVVPKKQKIQKIFIDTKKWSQKLNPKNLFWAQTQKMCP